MLVALAEDLGSVFTFSFFFKKHILLHYLFMCLSVSVCVYHGAHMEVRKQLGETGSFFPPCGFREMNSGHQI